MIAIPRPTYFPKAKAIANKLCELLEATTSYSNEPKDNLIHKPNHESPPEWRRFYSYGPVLVPDNSSVLSSDGKPTGYKLAVAAISYNQSVSAGEIITSANGTKYLVQTTGNLRKVK